MRISDWSSDVCSSDLVARHRRFAQLQRIHFTETLETRDLRLGAAAFSDQAIEDPILLGFVEGVEHLLACVDAKQRRHRDADVSRCNQWPEMLEEQRTQQQIGRASCRERVCKYV